MWLQLKEVSAERAGYQFCTLSVEWVVTVGFSLTVVKPSKKPYNYDIGSVDWGQIHSIPFDSTPMVLIMRTEVAQLET